MRCVVNFVQPGREKYLRGQARLLASLRKHNPDVATLFLSKINPPGCPGHGKVSHSFKPWIMVQARDLGATEILWLDASMVVRASLDPIWKLVENRGYYFEVNAGDNLKKAETIAARITDAQCRALGTDRDELGGSLQCSSGVVGLSMNQPLGIELLREASGYTCKSKGEAYGDSRVVTRHDQIVWSTMIHKKVLTLSPSNYMRYSWDSRGLDGVIVECRGIK